MSAKQQQMPRQLPQWCAGGTPSRRSVASLMRRSQRHALRQLRKQQPHAPASLVLNQVASNVEFLPTHRNSFAIEEEEEEEEEGVDQQAPQAPQAPAAYVVPVARVAGPRDDGAQRRDDGPCRCADCEVLEARTARSHVNALNAPGPNAPGVYARGVYAPDYEPGYGYGLDYGHGPDYGYGPDSAPGYAPGYAGGYAGGVGPPSLFDVLRSRGVSSSAGRSARCGGC